MKTYLVAYKSNTFIVESGIVTMPDNYSLKKDAESGFEKINDAIVEVQKPVYTSVYATPDSCGGRVSYTDYPTDHIKHVRILAVSELRD